MGKTAIKGNLKLSKRTKVRLTPEEIKQLKEYTEFDESAAYINIYNNAGIRRATIIATIERGWIELDPAIRLRDFLKEIKKLK